MWTKEHRRIPDFVGGDEGGQTAPLSGQVHFLSLVQVDRRTP